MGVMVKEHSSLISQFHLIPQISTKITVNNDEYCTLTHTIMTKTAMEKGKKEMSVNS